MSTQDSQGQAGLNRKFEGESSGEGVFKRLREKLAGAFLGGVRHPSQVWDKSDPVEKADRLSSDIG